MNEETKQDVKEFVDIIDEFVKDLRFALIVGIKDAEKSKEYNEGLRDGFNAMGETIPEMFEEVVSFLNSLKEKA